MLTDRQLSNLLNCLEKSNVSSHHTLMNEASKHIRKEDEFLVVKFEFDGECFLGIAERFTSDVGKKLFLECYRMDGTSTRFVVDENCLVDSFTWNYAKIK